MKNFSSTVCMLNALLALSACSIPLGPETDMQGIDPTEYYAAHPIENKVEARQLLQVVHFVPGEASLSDGEADDLRSGLRGISPAAVDSITIRVAEHDNFQMARENALVKLLRQMGYDKIQLEPSASVKSGSARIDIAYLTVISPDCPDWRMSPVTSHSNTHQGNLACATTTNIGLMVEDPHDLVRGTGDVTTDTARSARTVQEYNSGKDFMSNTVNAGISGGGGSGGSGSGTSSGVGGMNSSTAGGMSTLGGSQ